MTGHGTIDTAVQAMQQGALDYILKPFKLNTILPVIARALEVRRLRRENAELAGARAASNRGAGRRQSGSGGVLLFDLARFARAAARRSTSIAQMLQEDFARPSWGAKGAA